VWLGSMCHAFRHPNAREGGAHWGPRLPGFLIHMNSFPRRFHHPNARKGGARWGPRFFALG